MVKFSQFISLFLLFLFFSAMMSVECDNQRSPTSPGHIYYLSSTGNDANSGILPDQSWRTINKLNSVVFIPGDRIFFEAGASFNGPLFLKTKDTGADNNPIIITSLGNGRAVIFSNLTHGIYAYNSGGIEINNINLVGAGRAKNTGCGIFFYTDFKDGRSLKHITLENIEIRGFGTGISIGSGDASFPGYQDVIIRNVAAHDNCLAGISVWGKQGEAGSTKYPHRNFTIDHCKVYGNSGNSTKTDNHSGDGIVIGGVDQAMIEYCYAANNGFQNGCKHAGPCGIWAYESKGVIIQDNISAFNKNGNQPVDGDGFDLDGGCRDCIMQYNYSYENEGAGFLICQYQGARTNSHNMVRYNISKNDARRNSYGAISLWSAGSNGGIQNCYIYNNTVFMAPGATGDPAALGLQSNGISNVKVCNNIFVSTGGIKLINIKNNIKGLTFQGNDYWSGGAGVTLSWLGKDYHTLGDWQDGTGQEMLNLVKVGLEADPLLNNPSSAPDITIPEQLSSSLFAFQLQNSSPAFDQGLDLLAIYNINMGFHDFYNNPIPQKAIYDIGAYEKSR